jgi:hypothetical protein
MRGDLVLLAALVWGSAAAVVALFVHLLRKPPGRGRR